MMTVATTMMTNNETHTALLEDHPPIRRICLQDLLFGFQALGVLGVETFFGFSVTSIGGNGVNGYIYPCVTMWDWVLLELAV